MPRPTPSMSLVAPIHTVLIALFVEFSVSSLAIIGGVSTLPYCGPVSAAHGAVDHLWIVLVFTLATVRGGWIVHWRMG
ncbi:hypothetical protein DFH09DRAFT_1146611 [Mycena vulgaris]|nr:hypothetical protein DFH09DRAFT_1146611 [Mycena vulgaris]